MKTNIKVRVTSALNPGAHFSSLLINVLCGIFFPRIRHFYLRLKPVREISFLLYDFLNGIRELVCCLSVGRSCFSCYLYIFFKAKPFYRLEFSKSYTLLNFLFPSLTWQCTFGLHVISQHGK